MNATKQQKGQILVLFVLALVGLLALTALAIDGSMVYSDRRFDQSVADSAAMAGAVAAGDIIGGLSSQLFHCSNSDVITAMNNAVYAAQTRAANNGFTGATALALQDLSTQHGVYVTCNDSANPKYLDIEVQVSSETATSFAHLFFGQDRIRNTVTSVVRAYPQRAYASGYAIVGLSNTCETVLFSGNVNTSVDGGGVFSNGGITKNGGSGEITADVFSTVKSSCGPNGIAGHAEVLTGTKQTNQPPVKFDFPEIDCSTIPEVHKTGNTWPPGRHPGFKVNNDKDNTILAPGLHCLTSGIQVTGGKLTGEGVTLYFANGSFDGNGNGTVELSAPTVDTGNILNGMQGIVIYVDPDNPANSGSPVDLQGGIKSKYTGTIYVPKGNIDAGGNPTADGYKAQFIGWTVTMHGGPTTTVTYDESAFARQPATLDQYR